MADISEYVWKDRDDDVEGRLKSRGDAGDPIIGVIQLRSTPNAEFPKDRGGIGIEIDREQAAEIAEWLLNALRENTRAQVAEQ